MSQKGSLKLFVMHLSLAVLLSEECPVVKWGREGSMASAARDDVGASTCY